MKETLDRAIATDVFTQWLKAEHRRVHVPQKDKPVSLMSRLQQMRDAAELDFTDPMNLGARKTEQHLTRTRMRLESLRDEYDEEVAGRGLSDVLKLVGGQQVKRALAMARSQCEFSAFATSVYLSTPEGVAMARDPADMPSSVDDISPALDELDMKLVGSLEVVAARAQSGEDWGELNSPMVKAAFLGEVACYDAAFATIDYLAARAGGYEQVPLRVAAKDETAAPMLYPFKSV